MKRFRVLGWGLSLAAACLIAQGAAADGLARVKKDGALYHYAGQVQLSGSYDYSRDENAMSAVGDQFCFSPDKGSARKIPRERGDDRDRWFCFENDKQARTMLEVDKLLKDKRVCSLRGKATIEVDHYIADLTDGTEANDTARLLRVVRLAPAKTTPFVKDTLHCRE
ncbi:hypothetical protein [Chromobacterium phragmitis]|uniref:hypothetical protein n=1 Tax=Chromobacterium phragmitis TaxID=2202141 RepID=UPI0011AE96FA|nr:hypothetical protein [Chromobacterium phragmitis]